MWRIGITGGIGSGKSTLCRWIEAQGGSVFYSDRVARELMEQDAALRTRIESLVGSLDRAAIRNYIGQGAEYATRLNALVWPRVAERWNHLCVEKEQRGVKFIFMECALLFESGFDNHVDESILVTASEDVRIRRVVERDGITPDRARSIMALQMSESEKAHRATYILHNDSTPETLISEYKKLPFSSFGDNENNLNHLWKHE